MDGSTDVLGDELETGEVICDSWLGGWSDGWHSMKDRERETACKQANSWNEERFDF